MKIHDITVPLSPETPVYPGDPAVRIEPFNRISQGDHTNLSILTLGSHSGTHIDPPYHFDDSGRRVDELDLALLVGKALVVELTGTKEIGRRELEGFRIAGADRLLLKTDNSRLWQEPGFREDYAALTLDGAQYLLDAGVKLVGIDYLSIEGFHGDGEVHRTLLDNGILILEGVDLSEIKPGQYQLICLPLKVKGGDGAPVRALLVGGPEAVSEPGFDPHTSRWPLA